MLGLLREEQWRTYLQLARKQLPEVLLWRTLDLLQLGVIPVDIIEVRALEPSLSLWGAIM